MTPQDLRDLADFLEGRPGLTSGLSNSTLYAYASDTDHWAALRSELGSYDKAAADKYLYARRAFGDITLEVFVSKEQTCERRQVGERTVVREVYPDDVQPTYVLDVEPIYEWVCPPAWSAT